MRTRLKNLSKHIDGIHFLGCLVHDEVLRFLDNVDIFVLPSQFDLFPYSVLEAMSKQIPAIVTPVGELQYALKDRENCLFTKIGDAHDLAEKISALIEDKALAKMVAENGRRFVEGRRDIKKVIDQYVELYI